jgi:hypothetical protein
VAEHQISLPINDRESQPPTSQVIFETPGSPIVTKPVCIGSVAIAGLGYTGPPTMVELHAVAS